MSKRDRQSVTRILMGVIPSRAAKRIGWACLRRSMFIHTEEHSVHHSREIFGEMLSCSLVGTDLAKRFDKFFDDSRKLYYRRHFCVLLDAKTQKSYN